MALLDHKTGCRHEIAGHLVKLQTILNSWSLQACSKLTFLARNPEKPDELIVVTNESEDDLKSMCGRLAINGSENHGVKKI